jgi:hypothetical protein
MSRILDGRKFGKQRDGKYRCNQCRRARTAAQMTRGGKVRQDCTRCALRRSRLYAAGMTVSQRIDAIAKEYPRKDPKPSADGPRVLFKLRSGNKKLGPIPMSISEPGTCPTSCAMHNVGCYAGYGWNGTIWRKARKIGMTWATFVAAVRALPKGILWRHNEAGDLAGDGEGIDIGLLNALRAAASHTRAFTYSHRHARLADRTLGAQRQRAALRLANKRGFTINLSADSLDEADRLADLDVGPVVVTIATDERATRTPAGRKLVPCPAQTHDLTCAECELCAQPQRKSVVTFRSHGQGAALVSELVRGKRHAEVA